jgi:hypothetical protein
VATKPFHVNSYVVVYLDGLLINIVVPYGDSILLEGRFDFDLDQPAALWRCGRPAARRVRWGFVGSRRRRSLSLGMVRRMAAMALHLDFR